MLQEVEKAELLLSALPRTPSFLPRRHEPSVGGDRGAVGFLLPVGVGRRVVLRGQRLPAREEPRERRRLRGRDVHAAARAAPAERIRTRARSNTTPPPWQQLQTGDGVGPCTRYDTATAAAQQRGGGSGSTVFFNY